MGFNMLTDLKRTDMNKRRDEFMQNKLKENAE